MKSKSACLQTILSLLLVLLCLLFGLAGGLAWLLPQRAEQIFGEPTNQLGEWQRIYYAYRLIQSERTLTQPMQPSASHQSFQVKLGEPAASIALRLQEAGLIADAEAFTIYLSYTGLDTSLQAGEYKLSAGNSPILIAQSLLDATPMSIRFGILPGWRLEEIAATIPTSGLSFSADDFLAAARQPASTFSPEIMTTSEATLEGFLCPDVYEVRRDISLQEFLQTILLNFSLKTTSELLTGIERQGLTLYQAVILASIIEREAMVDEEMPQIASVFHNRLAIDMKLDSDPTVQYALGYNQTQKSWWTNPLSSSDLQVASPYNTYLTNGLPPGPISNVSTAALKAVAFPAQTPYYYFRAECDGSGKHVFAETFEQHVQNGCP
jgi:UPF0755 protein